MKNLFIRMFLWLFSRVCYRIKALQPDRLPDQGGALLVSNHVSFVDMLLILASTRRWVHFLIPTSVCDTPWLKPWLKMLQVIPLPPEDDPAELTASLRHASDLIRDGHVVGIFAERSVSRIGILLPFRRELERIMEGLHAPIIPVCLDGVWGSIFSYSAGRCFWKLPRQIPYPVTVSFGQPMPSTSTALEVRSAVQALNVEAWPHRKGAMKTLGRAFVRCARLHPFRFAMGDLRSSVRFSSALAQTIFLARRFRREWAGQRMVGICLPPCVPAALINFAVLLAGKVPVNLNYTLSSETLAACAKQCQLQAIVTSKLFLRRIQPAMPCPTIFLEDVSADPKWTEKLCALALAWLAPVRWIERAAGCERTPTLDDLATVVFSSGSTGDPKGVMLSHYNIVSNVEQLGQTYDFGPPETFLGVLPFFHSFGFTGTLMLPATLGYSVVFHNNPLETKAISELTRKFQVNILIATPGFLQLYLRSCDPADFASVHFVMVGAEKLQPALAAEFQKRFRIIPVEGYGCTECSPGVAANTRDFQAQGIQQTGARPGTIGHPLPGVDVRIVDPQTRAPLPAGLPGLLMVRGPNIMNGYLGRPEKTAEVLHDGWYETGDIATLHPDGFLEITDRLSRFSKIAGEMVPHVKVEEKLQALCGTAEPMFVVVGLPDEKRGERLVVLHRLTEQALAELLPRLAQSGLPNLWIPKANQFFSISDIPMLGTGKLDLRRVRELAATLASSK